MKVGYISRRRNENGKETLFMAEGKLIVVQEPFFTNDELKERLEKWCEWANSCEHREYSLFGEVSE